MSDSQINLDMPKHLSEKEDKGECDARDRLNNKENNQSWNQGSTDNKNGSNLNNTKFSVTHNNKTATLRNRFSGDNYVRDVAQVSYDENKEENKYNNHNNDKKELRKRLPNFKNEKGIKATLKPDCIYGWNDKKSLRVKMPCGHVFAPNTLFELTQQYVNDLTKSEIECPILKCKEIWPFDIIIAGADLDDKETEILRKTLSMYKVDNGGKNISSNSNDNGDIDIEIENKQNGSDSDNDNKAYDINFSQYCKVTKGNCCGLNNLGMTCFMNSALQCLMHTPNFSQDLLGYSTKQHLGYKKIENENENENENLNEYGTFPRSSGDTSQKIWRTVAVVAWTVAIVCVVSAIFLAVTVSRTAGAAVGSVAATSAAVGAVGIWKARSSGDTSQQTWITVAVVAWIVAFVCVVGAVFLAVTVNRTAGEVLGAAAAIFAVVGVLGTWKGGGAYNFERNCILNEWMYILNFIHVNKNDTYNPKQFLKFLGKENSQFCDGGQHDACEALLTILNGMECDYNRLFLNTNNSNNIKAIPVELEHSIFDKNYTNRYYNSMLKKIQSNGDLRIKNALNIVTKHFGSIQLTKRMCMNCGYGNLEYQQFYSLQVPVCDEYLQIELLKFDNKLNKFINVLNGINIATNSKIKLAKFYGLFYDKSIDITNSGMCNKLDNWDIIEVNGGSGSSSSSSSSSNSSNSGAVNMRIVSDNEALRRLTKIESLLMIENESICNDNANNDLKSIFDNICYKVIICYILPSNVLNNRNTNNNNNNNNIDPLYFSVLKIPCKYKQRPFTYKTLTKELESTNNYEMISNLLNGTQYSLVINVNGKKYDSSNENEFKLNENNNITIITFEDTSELNKQSEKARNSETVCAFNQFNTKYVVNSGQFVKLMSSELLNINDCINLYYNKSYVSSNTFEMKCQCYKLRDKYECNFKYSPIVCIEKKLLNSPNILILKLDRGNISSNKISHNVKFGKKLRLSQTHDKYNLFGISYHSGNNDGGHYTARIKKLGTNDEWYYCNDLNVQSCGGANVPCDNAMFMCYAKE